MATKKWKCHNFDYNTGKRRPDRRGCREPCQGVHPDEPGWDHALAYTQREKPHDRVRREHDRSPQRPVSYTGRPSTFTARDPPTGPASAWTSWNDPTTISPAPTSRSSRTNRSHVTSRVRSTSTANKTVGGWGSPPQNNGDQGSPVGWKNDGWGSPRADGGGWGSPVRDNTEGWLSPVAGHSGRDADWGRSANHPTTLPAPQPTVAKPKPAPVSTPTELMPFDKPTAKPALNLPTGPSHSATTNPHPITSNLTELTPMAAPARRSSASTRAPTPWEKSASVVISLPHDFISPSPAPSVPPKPRPPALHLPSRPLHSRRESLHTSTPATETAPPSAISVNSNYSSFAVPVVSASPRTSGFAPDSPISAISASTPGGVLRKITISGVTNVHGVTEKVQKEPAEVLWDENIEILCRALTRRRELQALMEQVKRRDQFYSTITTRHPSCSMPPGFNSPDDPLNQQVQEAQTQYEDVLIDLSNRKTSWWPTPALVNPREMLVELEKALTELEREIQEVVGVAVRSSAEDIAAATTEDIDMNFGKAEEQLDVASKAVPTSLTPAEVVLALEDLENRIEEIEGDMDSHLEDGLRRKVRAYLRKRFPPASGPAATERQRLEATLLRAKKAGTRVQGLEGRLAGLTMVSNADQIQLVRERIKKVGTLQADLFDTLTIDPQRREATQELVKKEDSILEFLSLHNASMGVPEDDLKEILKNLTADNKLISSIAKPYCDRIQARIDSIGTATMPEDSEAVVRKSRRERASDEIYELVAGAPQMQQLLTMTDWVQKNWGHIKRGESVGIGQQLMGMDVVMG